MVGQRFLQRVHPNPVRNLRHVASHLLPRDSHVSLERIEGLQQVRRRELEYGVVHRVRHPAPSFLQGPSSCRQMPSPHRGGDITASFPGCIPPIEAPNPTMSK